MSPISADRLYPDSILTVFDSTFKVFCSSFYIPVLLCQLEFNLEHLILSYIIRLSKCCLRLCKYCLAFLLVTVT